MGLFSKLQNGDTVLKSLKFGNDRPGGGDSGQPYIQKPIPDALKDNNALDSDFLFRGGINAPLDALTDVKRLTKYMFSLKSPSGLLFGVKQNLLSRTAVKTEAAFGIGYAGGALNEGIYTPLSTIAQAGVGFTGTHLNKQGLDPTGLISALSIRKYEDVISTQIFFDTLESRQEKSTNRLITLWDRKIKVKNISDVLDSYGGGPGSVLGIGKTTIKFAKNQRTGINGIQYPNSVHITNNEFQLPLSSSIKYNEYISPYSKDYIPVDNLINGGLKSYQENIINNVYKSGSLETQTLTTNIYNNYQTWTQEDIVKVSRNLGEKGSSGIRSDFRKELDLTNSTFLSKSPDYTTYNIEDNLGMGNPGQKGDISSYTDGKKINNQPSQPLDKVNASYIYKSEGKNRVDAQSVYNTDGDLRDIIPFYIAVLNNDLQEKNSTSTYKKYMHFRAFIDGFSDSYDAEWKSMEYMGRGEKFYKYGGFDRKIDLSFTVVAQSKGEITVMYDKLNFLASSLAPEYLDALSSGYMAGNIAYITLGQYIHEQPGVITSLSFDIPEESPWEIGIDDDGSSFLPDNNGKYSDVRQVPHMIKVKMNFTPIHKFRPEKQRFGEDTPGTNSTRLLDTGGQRFVDQLRPKTTNYDREAQERLTNRLEREKADKEAIAKREAEKDRIIQSVTPGSGTVDTGLSLPSSS